ncbi:hypothetical protein TNCV_890931 [Trichonephila clavipes]|nr:hypothetical protein TNCV_890931 [Trichonephila clavipes]
MSESSDYVELSPSKFDQVSACAKLRDTVTGISKLFIFYSRDGRTFSQPGNSFHGHVHFRQTRHHDREKSGDGKVKVEGYLVRGITQYFSCNNFYHTAANCFMKPRCHINAVKTMPRNCRHQRTTRKPILYQLPGLPGHSACYTKCPKFQPKKGAAFSDPIKEKIFFKQMD